MRATKLLFGAAFLSLSGMSAGGASATTITFGGLAGANGDPFTTYVESGFTVAPTLGSWFQGQLFGNPVPSIFAGPINDGPTTDAITVTDGARFTFSELDLAANNGDVGYTFTGTLLGAPVFNVSATQLSDTGVFHTELSGVSGSQIDKLVVTTVIGGTSTNIDNIVVNAVPVPKPGPLGTLLLLGFGLASLSAARARRGRA